MRRVLAAIFCFLWLSYGTLSGLAHTHADVTPDQHHGLGLDHAHDSLDGHAPGHDHASGVDRASAGAHHAGPLYLSLFALKPAAKTVVVPIPLAGESIPATLARMEPRPFDSDPQPRDPPSKDPPGLRAPPA